MPRQDGRKQRHRAVRGSIMLANLSITLVLMTSTQQSAWGTLERPLLQEGGLPDAASDDKGQVGLQRWPEPGEQREGGPRPHGSSESKSREADRRRRHRAGDDIRRQQLVEHAGRRRLEPEFSAAVEDPRAEVIAQPNRTHPVQLPGDLADHLLVIPEHKLLFCYIAKNNCLSFNDLFRSLRERYDPSLAEGPSFGRNSYTNHNMTLEQLTEYIYDPTWHKAVFYREPLVRFVSAYRSKCVREKHAGNEVCQSQFGIKHPLFKSVVKRLTREPPIENPHWRPQADFCGGLSGILSEFQTIEPLDARTSREKVAKLLKQVGIEDPESIPAFNERFPPPDPETGVWRPEQSPFHTTNADSVVAEYYTPFTACTVFQYYLDDFLLFGIPAPEWTRQWDFHAQHWTTGDCKPLQWI